MDTLLLLAIVALLAYIACQLGKLIELIRLIWVQNEINLDPNR